MKVLVTGGAGFIGSTLVDRLLAEGHAVDAVDDLSTGSLANLAEARADRSHDFTFHRMDVSDAVLADLVARRRPEVVFHLAVPAGSASTGSGAGDGGDGPRAMVLGVQQVLAAARSAGVAKVVVGLDARHRYGTVSASDLPLAESFAGRHEGHWGDSFRVVVGSLETARADDAIEFTALALATVYGPRQPPSSPVGRLVGQALQADPRPDGPTLAAGVGTGWSESTDDLLFVDDAVDALVRASSRGSGLMINVGTGVATTGADLAVAVVAAVAAERGQFAANATAAVTTATAIVDPPVGSAPAVLGVDHFALDPARAGMQLGWKHWTTVAEGVGVTVSWQAVQTGVKLGPEPS